MHIHILGICGTFMGGVAVLAKQMGHTVSGSDENVYPPMSDELRALGIDIYQGYDATPLKKNPDYVIIGNALSRGNPAVEYVLNKGLRYTSGPQWLAEQILVGRHVLAVAGTHGKTTTSSLLAWILEHAGLQPGYLIGGVAKNFARTAELGESSCFVIEADEYDSAFFDKRSKFIHYRPRTLILNNLEYDHADIFPDLEAIKWQFQCLLRTVPACGTVIHPSQDPEVIDVMARGCWAATVSVGPKSGVWQARHASDDGSRFELWHRDQKLGAVSWSMLGQYNIQNALAAIAAAHEVGVTADVAMAALKSFKGVKRRLEIRGEANGIMIYDDFAHHPTAIAATVGALRAKVGKQKIFAVLQFASNTMRMGVHRDVLADSLKEADRVILLRPEDQRWDINSLMKELGARARIFDNTSDIVNGLMTELHAGDHVLIMSNKSFEGIHQRLLDKLQVARI